MKKPDDPRLRALTEGIEEHIRGIRTRIRFLQIASLILTTLLVLPPAPGRGGRTPAARRHFQQHERSFVPPRHDDPRYHNPYLAMTVTNLATNLDNTGGATINSISISPSANALVLGFIGVINNGGSPATPTVTGGGMTTFTTMGTPLTGATDTTMKFMMVRALQASPGSGAVSMAYGATQTRSVWSFIQITGTDTTGTNGAGAVVQSAYHDDTAGTTTPGTTLSAFADAVNNIAVGAVHPRQTAAATVGSGFTSIGTANNGAGSAGNSVLSEYQVGFSAPWKVGFNTGNVAVLSGAAEIKPGGTTYNQTASDGAVVGDAAVPAVTVSQSVSDGAVVGDAASPAGSTFGVTASDGAPIGDAAVIATIVSPDVNIDGPVVGDAASAGVGVAKTAADGAVAGDQALAFIASLADTVDDNLLLLDAAAAFVDHPDTGGGGDEVGNVGVSSTWHELRFH